MRRSGAPSQAGTWRPKFVAPLKQQNQADLPKSSNEDVKENKTQSLVLKRLFSKTLSDEKAENAPINETDKVTDKTKALLDNENASFVQPVKKPKFESPLVKKSSTPAVLHPKALNTDQGSNDKKDDIHVGYLSVVWCKRSSKKHKKWEGDAVLVTKGRSVTLYDIEGKEIGKGSGYKSTELASLCEDETLPIGGKEIQVMSKLSEDQFKSGKCFSGNTVDVQHVPKPSTLNKGPNPASKPFCRPQTAGTACPSVVSNRTDLEPASIKPRHDPDAPDALVLTRPSSTHQWMWNKKALPVIEVVVDPYLSYNLRPHQREGVTFLYECTMGYRNFGGCGAILADDMGLGKTLQCICLIWTLLKQGPYGGKAVAKRVLIVTPGSLVKNWFQEFKKWLGTERLKVYAVSSDKKVEEFLKSSIYPVLIISYEMFVRMYEMIKQVKFDLIVCDEGHRLKNTAIKTTSLIMSLPTERRVVLTGTPIQNDLQEFYSIVEFCNPGVLGTSASFRRVYEDPIVAARQPGAKLEDISLGEERGAELSRMTQMFILRRTQEVNNKYLPPKSEIVVFCKPTKLQTALYQQLLRCQLIKTCLSGNMGGAPHLICIGALKKLCNHPSLVYRKTVCREDQSEGKKWDTNSLYDGLQSLFPEDYSELEDLESKSGKLFVLSELLGCLYNSNTNEKIVVVSNHTKTLDMIQCMCATHGYEFLRLDGQTPTSKRQELVTKFNSSYSKEFIFLLSSKAGGVGLNLIGASRLVLYDIDWNPANDLQAMARVWRDGQKRKVHIYRFLTTGTIEEKIFQRQICKQGLSGAVMDVREKNDVQFSLDDLKDLFSVNLNTDCDTHDLLNCDCIGTTPEIVEPVQKSINRPCQLGVPKSAKRSKNIGMDELMDWKHYPGAIIKDHQEWYLEGAIDKVSFVFYSDVHGGS